MLGDQSFEDSIDSSIVITREDGEAYLLAPRFPAVLQGALQLGLLLLGTIL